MPSFEEVIRCLDQAGLKWQDRGRYLFTQCPMPGHDDRNRSAQIFKNDWFVSCMATCGRFPIQQAFPELADKKADKYQRPADKRIELPSHYKKFDLMDVWLRLRPIPDDHQFKGLTPALLNDLGWRFINGEVPGMGSGYFIPYWNEDRSGIPFAQTRHLTGERRFTFLKDAKPTLYGWWKLPGAEMVFLVEGASDAATLEYLGIPWVSAPSAASTGLLGQLVEYCHQHRIAIIYAGDNDEAGDKLLEALAEMTSYRVLQPPKPHKDWSDFYQATDYQTVIDYCGKELL